MTLRYLMWVVGVFAIGSSAKAQTQIPLCQRGDVQASFYFDDLPDQQQFLSVAFRNRTGHGCRLMYLSRLSVSNNDEDAEAGAIRTCAHYHGLPCGEVAPAYDPGLVLEPGASAHVSYEWTSSGPKDECSVVKGWQNGIHFSVNAVGKVDGIQLDFIPAHWPVRICSEIQIPDFQLGELPEQRRLDESERQFPLPLSISPDPLYADEAAKLTVSPPVNSDGFQNEGCPELYLFDGTTLRPIWPGDISVVPFGVFHFEPSNPDACRQPTPLTPIVITFYGQPIPHSGTIYWRVASARTGEHLLLHAPLRLDVRSTGSLPIHWAHSEGISLGLALDRDTYRKGEYLPAHVAIVNHARRTIGVAECPQRYRGDRTSIEVEDAQHHILHSTGDTANAVHVTCMGGDGNGWDPDPLKRGDLGSDAEDMTDGFQKLAPGVYYLTASWTPRIRLRLNGTRRKYVLGRIYARLKTPPVKITILAGENDGPAPVKEP